MLVTSSDISFLHSYNCSNAMLCRDLEWCQTYEHLSEHHGLSGLGHTVYREDTIKSTKTFMEFDFLMIFGIIWTWLVQIKSYILFIAV